MAGPASGAHIQIESYKHNGSLHRVWHDSYVLNGTEQECIIANDRTLVSESDGRAWVTREPAVCYFHADIWFNVIGMIRDDGIYYYCNIGSPFIYDHNMNVLKYIDYDLDVKVYPDMTYVLLDEDEYEAHRIEMGYPDKLDRILRAQVDELTLMIRQRRGPFAPGFVDWWYERFLTYR